MKEQRNPHMSKSSRAEGVSILEKKGIPGLSDESQIFNWIAENGKNLAYLIAGLFALFFIIYWLSAGNRQKAEHDYLNAYAQYAIFQHSEGQNQEALDKLAAIMKRHPELHAQYDGLVAQLLINEGKMEQADEYIERSLSRISKDRLPLYENFASTTQLIGEQKFSEALTQALELQQKTLNLSPSETILIGLNRFRIAMLYQQLGMKENELKAWNELRSYLTATPSASSLVKQLTFGKVSLSEYIDYRLKQLKN